MSAKEGCGYFTGDTVPPGCKQLVAKAKERIAELEEQLMAEKSDGTVAKVRTLNKATIRYWKDKSISLKERIAELEVERDEAFNKGMERAAEIVNTENYAPLEDFVDNVMDEIRREIDK